MGKKNYLKNKKKTKNKTGISPVIQWLSLHTSSGGDPGLIPGQGTRSHMLQLGSSQATAEDPMCHN